MDRFETQTTLKLLDGFKAVQTVLKLARPFWNPQVNTNSFKVVQGSCCSLLDCFKAVCSDGTNALEAFVHSAKPYHP